jgi:hypothetical protein
MKKNYILFSNLFFLVLVNAILMVGCFSIFDTNTRISPENLISQSVFYDTYKNDRDLRYSIFLEIEKNIQHVSDSQIVTINEIFNLLIEDVSNIWDDSSVDICRRVLNRNVNKYWEGNLLGKDIKEIMRKVTNLFYYHQKSLDLKELSNR